MSEEEIKEAKSLIRPYAKRIHEASTGREVVIGHNRWGDICADDSDDYQHRGLALVAELKSGGTKMFCSMAAIRIWVARQKGEGEA